MKVFIISSIPEKLDNITGGVESVTVNLLYAFCQSDVELTVISFGKEIKKSYIYKYAPNIRIYYYPYRFIKSNKLFFIISGAMTVNKLVKQLDPDIIHLQGNGSSLLLLNKLKNKNIVITPHADLKGEYLKLIKIKDKINQKVVIFIERWAMRKHYNIIFISKYLKELYYRLGKVNVTGQQAVIYNPVNPLFFSVKDNDQINRLNILYIGEITKRKGLLVLLETLNELKIKGIIYHLNIVGDYKDNIYKEMVISQIKKNKMVQQLTFYGWISQKQIAGLMDQNGIFILPSYQESLPMSVIEAMSGGKLVIANNTGGIKEIITNGVTGYIYQDNDVKQLSSILENLYCNPSTFLSISQNARLFAKANFDPKVISEKTKSFYSSIINR